MYGLYLHGEIPTGMWAGVKRKRTPSAPPAAWRATTSGLTIGRTWGLCYKEGRLVRIPVPFINFPAREINCKLVYYGPGLGGKTAICSGIYDHHHRDRSEGQE